MNKELREALQGIIEQGGFVLELETESSVAFGKTVGGTKFVLRLNLLEEDVLISNFINKQEVTNSEFGQSLMMASMVSGDTAPRLLKPLAETTKEFEKNNSIELTDENIDMCNDVIASALGNVPQYINDLDVDEDRKCLLKRMCKVFIANTVIQESGITLDDINKYWGLSCD